MITKSTDRGASWSTPAALPVALGLDRAETGPGRALQLSRPPHSGRLIFSGWRDQKLGEKEGEIVFYSDDGGSTFAAAPSFAGGGAEAQLAESSNGTVIAMFRINQDGDQSSKGRLLASSVDGGAHFSPARFDADLRSVPCQASILRSKESGRVYYSAPSDLKLRKLGLVRSSPNGLDWSNRSGSAVTEGGQGFGYSSLTEVRAAGVLGLLWEKQVVGTHQPTELAFSHIPL